MKGKKILALLLLVCCFFLSSCIGTNNNNAVLSKDINVYDSGLETDGNLEFNVSSSSHRNDSNHLLTISYIIRIKNNDTKTLDFNLSKAKAYGNDEELVEKVYEKFAYVGSEENKLFDKMTLSIPQNEYREFQYYLPIPDGNIDAKIRVDFKFNNVKLSSHNHTSTYNPDEFIYVHNPLYSEAAMADVEADPNAVYGFKPNSTGSLKQYVGYEWTNPTTVATYKQDRIKYVESNDKKIKQVELALRDQNKSIEEIARACSTMRNQNRMDQYKDDPEGLALLKQRNLEKYGHEEGPTPDELFAKYNSWEMVLEKSYSPNKGMDACCGVYDMYYYL